MGDEGEINKLGNRETYEFQDQGGPRSCSLLSYRSVMAGRSKADFFNVVFPKQVGITLAAITSTRQHPACCAGVMCTSRYKRRRGVEPNSSFRWKSSLPSRILEGFSCPAPKQKSACLWWLVRPFDGRLLCSIWTD